MSNRKTGLARFACSQTQTLDPSEKKTEKLNSPLTPFGYRERIGFYLSAAQGWRKCSPADLFRNSVRFIKSTRKSPTLSTFRAASLFPCIPCFSCFPPSLLPCFPCLHCSSAFPAFPAPLLLGPCFSCAFSLFFPDFALRPSPACPWRCSPQHGRGSPRRRPKNKCPERVSLLSLLFHCYVLAFPCFVLALTMFIRAFSLNFPCFALRPSPCLSPEVWSRVRKRTAKAKAQKEALRGSPP